MSTDEKIELVGGPYVGYVAGNARLGIPHIKPQDGPQGVGGGATNVTCFPCALSVVQTWDRSLFREFAVAMAQEQRGKGSNVLLGPQNNIARVPCGGRNFESAGEDPLLASAFAREVVEGIQSQGIVACDKHFANNNQEEQRLSISVTVDEKTQWELYYPHFQAAVDAGVGSIMCSYNKVNGVGACENSKTLSDLKVKMGFNGFVVSDWWATHSTVDSANGGLDMEMPSAQYYGSKLAQAVHDGTVSEERLDDMAARIATALFAAGLFDRRAEGSLDADVRSKEHSDLALRLSEASAVLLKNNGVLPISRKATVALIGKPASEQPLVHGGGSGAVNPSYVVTALDGLLAAGVAEVLYDGGSDVAAAAALAASADVAVVMLAQQPSEGGDRDQGLSLGAQADALVQAVAANQARTVVVIHNPGAVVMPWVGSVAAVIARLMPGQEDGNALAAVLLGDVNPSGRLAITFPRGGQNETWLRTAEQYPGVEGAQTYSEGLLVGHRWYDAYGGQPLFAFGHGLSYTSFEYSDVSASKSSVSFELRNAGRVAGAEVPQLYISFPEGEGEPPKQLKGFDKVFLQPGESRVVKFALAPRDLSVYDVSAGAFREVHGKFIAVNGVGACENSKTLSDLKVKMGFNGFVVSDWWATHSTVDSANGGLDMEMPSAQYYGSKLAQAVHDGTVSEERLDDMAARIATALFAAGLFDRRAEGSLDADVRSKEHSDLALRLSEASAVLLKNNGVLPISRKATVALIGKPASEQPLVHGGGSGAVNPSYVVTALDGLLAAGVAKVLYDGGSDVAAAAALAASADVAVVMLAQQPSEGGDRDQGLSLGAQADALVQAVAANQARTVVVIHNPGAVVMPWVGSVAAVIARLMPGQEDGNALAAVLLGDVNPSGRLAITFPRGGQNETWLRTAEQYPGVEGAQTYSEGLLVGHRWYDAYGGQPLFAFGHGLSYTSFEYSDVSASKSSVSFELRNAGRVAGAEVPQLYISFPEGEGEPPKQLKGFDKVFLQPGESRVVKFALAPRDLSVYDVSAGAFREVHGKFIAYIGASSADIRLFSAFVN
eukprot:m51a1_g13801 hypothetical protein (1062) ;mRNA; f:364023-367797